MNKPDFTPTTIRYWIEQDGDLWQLKGTDGATPHTFKTSLNRDDVHLEMCKFEVMHENKGDKKIAEDANSFTVEYPERYSLK